MPEKKCPWLAVCVAVTVLLAAGLVAADPPSKRAAAKTQNTGADARVVDQLRMAAKQLADLGQGELAARVQEVADRRIKQQVLAEKKQQLATLQREVKELQAELGLDTQILLRLQLIDCTLDDQFPSTQAILQKMDAIAGDAAAATDRGLFRLFDTDKAVTSVLEELKKAKRVKVLAEPSIVTLIGRPASLHVGGEIPLPFPTSQAGTSVKLQKMGTLVDVLPTLNADGSVRLELRLVVRHLDEGRRTRIGEKLVPGLRTRALNTVVNVRPGQTFVLAGLERKEASERQGDSLRTALLLTVVTELVSPPASAELPVPARR